MSDRKQFHDLSDPDDAAAIIADLPIEPGTTTVPLAEAHGHVLSERIDATIDVPGFDRANLDGYAVRAADTFGAGEADPVELSVIGAVHAGEQPECSPDSGQAAEISTGAVMPDTADAMVPIERIEEQGDTILVYTAVTPGENVMYAGADIAAGERALGPGTRLTTREIGLLSALGYESVPVVVPPTVGIISTGDELVRPGKQLSHQRGEIHDVNTYTLAAAVEDAGGDSTVYPHVGDDVELLREQLLTAAEECDLVLTSGSTSASAVDVVYEVLETEGERLLHGVAMKPGKPLLVGTIADTAYVGLPGFPLSAVMNFRTLVAPALRTAAGREVPPQATVTGEMVREERYEEGRRRLLPVGLIEDGNGNTLVYPVDKGSGATTSLGAADGIVTVPGDTAYLAAGDTVEVDLFSPDVRPPTVLLIGEDDPLVSRLLDQVRRPRYLTPGTRVGYRRLNAGVPDVAVLAGPLDRDLTALPGTVQHSWKRSFGLIVAAGNPHDVTGLTSLVDQDLAFVNRTGDSGLRASLERAIESLATDRGVSPTALQDRINGWQRTVRGHESPARRVQDGTADVGIGLATTAAQLDLSFVSLGTQPVRLVYHTDRLDKSGLQDLETVLADRQAIQDTPPRYVVDA